MPNAVSKDDFDQLMKRVETLEQRLSALEKAVNQQPSTERRAKQAQAKPADIG